MPASRDPRVDKAIEIIRSGRARSFADAARRTGANAEAVNRRWHNHHDGEDPRFIKAPPAEDRGPSEEREPTPAERELATKLREARKRAEGYRIEASEAQRVLAERESDLRKLRTVLNLREEIESVPDPGWTTYAPDDSKHRGIFVAQSSDWHYGEVVEPAEMAWYNAYNMDIAEYRTGRFFERTIHIARRYLNGVDYEGIIVPHLGDLATGDIHDELRETNEMSLYKVVPRAAKWIETGLGNFADEFGKVHVPCVPGNHPRDSKKPRMKKRAEHNADTLIMELVASKFENDDRVTFDIPASYSTNFSAYDVDFRIEHGDEARGGSGIQGALLPITLRTHRVRKQAEAEGHPFDVLLMGHWHQLMQVYGKGFGVNGSGKGYDEFARAKGFEPEPPQQGLILVTPELGISGQWPLYVGKRDAEGW